MWNDCLDVSCRFTLRQHASVLDEIWFVQRLVLCGKERKGMQGCKGIGDHDHHHVGEWYWLSSQCSVMYPHISPKVK